MKLLGVVIAAVLGVSIVSVIQAVFYVGLGLTALIIFNIAYAYSLYKLSDE